MKGLVCIQTIQLLAKKYRLLTKTVKLKSQDFEGGLIKFSQSWKQSIQKFGSTFIIMSDINFFLLEHAFYNIGFYFYCPLFKWGKSTIILKLSVHNYVPRSLFLKEYSDMFFTWKKLLLLQINYLKKNLCYYKSEVSFILVFSKFFFFRL